MSDSEQDHGLQTFLPE